jgi:hypothetical protein
MAGKIDRATAKLDQASPCARKRAGLRFDAIVIDHSLFDSWKAPAGVDSGGF